MLRIRLLTIEDVAPRPIYESIHGSLSRWFFVEKQLVELATPAEVDDPWVTNLEDWRSVMRRIHSDYDLIFCTVDLRIPTSEGDTPDAANGLAIVREIRAEYGNEVQCCVLTGMDSAELEALVGDVSLDVLFDFKGDEADGYESIVGYVRSQILARLSALRYELPGGRKRAVALADQSSQLQDQYLSKAAYFTDPATWHIPTLVVGDHGLGGRTFVEFVSFLADAPLTVIDLAVSSRRENRLALEELRGLGAQTLDGERRLVLIENCDRYPESSNPAQDCLRAVETLMDTLEESPSDGLGLFLRVSGSSRLRIKAAAGRKFIRRLEERIARQTGYPLWHLGMDLNGWVLGHQRIVHLPSLEERGAEALEEAAQAELDLLSDDLKAEITGWGDATLQLSRSVHDLLFDKINWQSHGNVGGLIAAIRAAAENFRRQRSEGQREITRAHLGKEIQDWIGGAVFNVDDLRIEFPAPGGTTMTAVQRADFLVEEGEFLVILGPSGCGKSTVLRALGGLLLPTSGEVTYCGTPVRGPSAAIGMVFQDYSLFPWLSVADNVAFGPRHGGRDGASARRIEELIDYAGLTDFEQAFPRQLSGGMRQRVAIIRTLANEPKVVLMDEPFGALDLQTRWQMQDFLLRIREKVGLTVVFVTHDIYEAVYLADRIFIGSPRPLHLAESFDVPFSYDVRNAELRRDPLFISLVSQVRQSLVHVASGGDQGQLE